MIITSDSCTVLCVVLLMSHTLSLPGYEKNVRCIALESMELIDAAQVTCYAPLVH